MASRFRIRRLHRCKICGAEYSIYLDALECCP